MKIQLIPIGETLAVRYIAEQLKFSLQDVYPSAQKPIVTLGAAANVVDFLNQPLSSDVTIGIVVDTNEIGYRLETIKAVSFPGQQQQYLLSVGELMEKNELDDLARNIAFQCFQVNWDLSFNQKNLYLDQDVVNHLVTQLLSRVNVTELKVWYFMLTSTTYPDFKNSSLNELLNELVSYAFTQGNIEALKSIIASDRSDLVDVLYSNSSKKIFQVAQPDGYPNGYNGKPEYSNDQLAGLAHIIDRFYKYDEISSLYFQLAGHSFCGYYSNLPIELVDVARTRCRIPELITLVARNVSVDSQARLCSALRKSKLIV